MPRKLGTDYDGLIVDLDGVVWVGDSAVPGAADALAAVRARGTRLLFLTNDPRSSPGEYASRLRTLGIEALETEVLTAAGATAAFLAERESEAVRRVYVVGSPALKSELEAAGLEVVQAAGAEAVDAVVVGGHESFDYDELRTAAQIVRAGARLYATGRDAVFPMPDGPWPATGSILAAIETAAAATALVVGKPEPYMFEIARLRLAGCRRVAVVGDHLFSDIAGGKRAGLDTILVLTGATRKEDLAGAPVEPDLVVPSLAALR
jgi:glycerol 3-phosphatase-2